MNQVDQAYSAHDSPTPARRGNGFKFSFGSRIGVGSLARLCHNVGTSLHAGIDVRRVFESEAQRGWNAQRRHMRMISDGVARGDSLAESFKSTGGYFPSMVREMVEVGEKTGRLEAVFFRLGQHYKNVLNLRRAFLIGIAWPMIELVLALFAVGGFILVVGMVSTGPDPPPITFFGLYGMKGFAIYASVIAVFFAAIAFTVLAVSKEWLDLSPVYMLLTFVPGIGTGLRIMAMSRMTWSLSLVTDTELSPERAIELSLRTTQNLYYTQHLDAMTRTVAGGESMLEAFRRPGIFPNDFLEMLETGELTGQISESMARLAEEYEHRVKMFFRLFAITAGVGVFLLVAGFIIFMIFNLMLQYVGILEEATKF